MKVTILGCGGSFGSPLAWEKYGNIDINHIAKKIDSTSYVLVTALGIRPKRIY